MAAVASGVVAAASAAGMPVLPLIVAEPIEWPPVVRTASALCRVPCKSAYKRPRRRVRGNGDGDGAAAAAAASHLMAAAVSVADAPPCAALGRVSAGRVSPICARRAARLYVSFWQRMHGIEK